MGGDAPPPLEDPMAAFVVDDARCPLCGDTVLSFGRSG